MRKETDAMQQINFRRLSYLRALAEYGTTIAAGQHLGVDKTLISSEVSKLEEELKVNLTEQVGRRLVLTEHGKVLCAFAQEVLDKFAELDFEHLAYQEKNLRIGCSDEIAQLFLPDIICEFKTTFPKIAIKVFCGPSYDDLTQGNCDVMIGGEVESKAKLHQTFLRKNSYYYYASKKYLERHPLPIKLADLENHTQIINMDKDTLIEELQYKEEDLVVRELSYLCLAEMVRKGNGIACLPKLFIDKYVPSPTDFVILFNNEPAFTKDLYFIQRKKGPKSAIIDELREVSVQVFNS